MKLLENILVYCIPLLVWGVYLCLSPYPYLSYTANLLDVILLFFLLPLGYGIYHCFAGTKKEWLLRTLSFIVVHVLGCMLNQYVCVGHFFGMFGKPMASFSVHLMIIDVCISLLCYFVKSAFVKHK